MQACSMWAFCGRFLNTKNKYDLALLCSFVSLTYDFVSIFQQGYFVIELWSAYSPYPSAFTNNTDCHCQLVLRSGL